MGSTCNSPNNKRFREENNIKNFPNPKENFKYNNAKNNGHNLTAENSNKFKKKFNTYSNTKNNSFDKIKTNDLNNTNSTSNANIKKHKKTYNKINFYNNTNSYSNMNTNTNPNINPNLNTNTNSNNNINNELNSINNDRKNLNDKKNNTNQITNNIKNKIINHNNININNNKKSNKNSGNNQNTINKARTNYNKDINSFNKNNNTYIIKTKTNNSLKNKNKKNIKLEINEDQDIIKLEQKQTNEFKDGIEFTLEATLGEVELPVYIKENQRFEIIILNENEKWNFFSDEEPVSILGYENLKKYNNFNIGSLLYRISSSSEFKKVNLKGKTIISENSGSLLLSANLDPNETDYEPEGKIHLKIKGVDKLENNDFYHKIDELNGFKLNELNMNQINNEKEINVIRYVNMIRVNAKNFCDYYLFDLNEETRNFLHNFSSLHDLTLNLDLSKIAINLAEKIGNEGTTGHINSELKIDFQKYNNENIKSYGKNFLYGINNPLLIVSRMINDNYKNDLKNRNNILESKFTEIGVAIRNHLTYKWICVIIFVEK